MAFIIEARLDLSDSTHPYLYLYLPDFVPEKDQEWYEAYIYECGTNAKLIGLFTDPVTNKLFAIYQ